MDSYGLFQDLGLASGSVCADSQQKGGFRKDYSSEPTVDKHSSSSCTWINQTPNMCGSFITDLMVI